MAIYAIPLDGTPGVSFTIVATADTVYAMTTAEYAAKLVSAAGQHAKGCVITCETKAARVAWGVDPNRSDPLGMFLDVNDVLIVNQGAWARQLRFTNATAGQNTRLQFTPYY